jgi:hypothetical protein
MALNTPFSTGLAASLLALSGPAFAGGNGAEWLATNGTGPDNRFYGEVFCAAIFDDGGGPDLYLGGNMRALRLDGTNWSPLNGGPGLPFDNDRPVHALAVFDDGSGEALYAAGDLEDNGEYYVRRWSGTGWATVGLTFQGGHPFAMTVYDDGSGSALYVAGSFVSSGGALLNRVAKWNGIIWSPVGAGWEDTVFALEVFDDGTGPALYAGGQFTDRVARWDGTTWTAFGQSVDGAVRTFTVFDDGTGPALYAGGAFDNASGMQVNHIAKWNGTTWSGLGGGVDDTVFALSVFDDGSGEQLYVGGDFITATGVQALGSARWSGTSWGALQGGYEEPVYVFQEFDDGTGNRLFAGGGRDEFNGFAASWLGEWTVPGQGLDSFVRDTVSFDDGSGPALCAVGDFLIADGQYAHHVASWDGDAWSPLGSGLNDAGYDADVFEGDLHVVGDFSASGGTVTEGIARWTGSAWTGVGGGLTGIGRKLLPFDDGTGPALYVGGGFTAAGGVPANNIARWDGTSWSALAGGSSITVQALGVFDDGSGPALYAGGQFTTQGTRIARWDGTGWSPLGSGLSGVVLALEVWDSGSGPPRLYVGGNFDDAGGIANADNLAFWTGHSWSATGIGPTSHTWALEVFDDGSGEALYVGGSFSYGAGFARNILRFQNGAWASVGGGLRSTVFSLTAYEDAARGGPALVVGGSVLEGNGTDDWYITRWGRAVDLPDPFCFGDGTGDACPCGNLGAPGHGCDIPSGTGGIRLRAESWSPNFAGGGQVDFVGSGFPVMSEPAAHLIRSTSAQSPAAVFGDGLLCIAPAGLVRLNATLASGGLSVNPTMHGAGAGTYHYQLWVRSFPISFCDPIAAYNLSNGVELTWP